MKTEINKHYITPMKNAKAFMISRLSRSKIPMDKFQLVEWLMQLDRFLESKEYEEWEKWEKKNDPLLISINGWLSYIGAFLLVFSIAGSVLYLFTQTSFIPWDILLWCNIGGIGIIVCYILTLINRYRYWKKEIKDKE